MSRINLFRASLLATAMFAVPAYAQDAGSMVDQLLPKAANPTVAPAETPVFSVQNATKAEMIGRLGTEMLTRSIDPKTSKARSIVIGTGHEAEDLAALRPLPSMQVAVAFQGSSDALSPESGPLLGTLADALNDPKLASYRFVIGVHTNSIGSDNYNLSLASLRAKAIVDQLVAVHGLSKSRLYAIGFGRIADGASGTEASERIRVVNLGDIAVVPAGGITRPVATAVAPSPAIKTRLHASREHKVAPRVVRRRVHAPTLEARETWPRPRYHVARPTHALASRRWQGQGRSDAEQGYFGSVSSYGAPSGYGSDYGVSSGFARAEGNGSGGSGGSGASSGGGSSGGGSSGGGSSGGGGGGGNAGGGWSDRRLKRDIRRLGLSPSGLTIYSFRYIWGGPMMVGVMAQDLLMTRSDAVLIGPGGYMQVDYDLIDVKMMTLEAWLQSRVSV